MWGFHFKGAESRFRPIHNRVNTVSQRGDGYNVFEKKKQSFNILPTEFKNCMLHIRSNYEHPKRLGFCSTVVKTPTQLQFNNNSTKVGFDIKMNLHTTPPPPSHPTTAETPITQYLSGYSTKLIIC